MEPIPGNAPKDEGIRLLKAGQVSEAIAKFEEALATDADDAQLHGYLGAAYNSASNRLHAIHHFEESLRLDETPRAYFNLGLMYETVHRVDEAVRQYRMALELNPDYAPAQEALKKLQDRYESEHQVAEE